MHVIIDRIEDGKIVVMRGLEGGEMFIPVNLFPFPIHEGMHLELTFHEQPKEEEDRKQSIEDLQKKLRKEHNQ